MLDAIQNELQYRFGTKGANEGTVRKGPDGQYNIGIMGRALGVTPEMMETAGNNYDRRNFASTQLGQLADTYGLLPETGGTPNKQALRKEIANAQNLEQVTKLAIANGVDPSKLEGLDVGSISSLNRNQKELNANDAWSRNPANIQEQSRYYDLQQDKITDRRQQADNRRFDRKERALDRKQTQDLAILSGDHAMKIQQMNAELADKRMAYDRETRSMDKRDRMIAQLMAGLGSLGSAF